jgi:hypothetical protein
MASDNNDLSKEESLKIEVELFKSFIIVLLAVCTGIVTMIYNGTVTKSSTNVLLFIIGCFVFLLVSLFIIRSLLNIYKQLRNNN